MTDQLARYASSVTHTPPLGLAVAMSVALAPLVLRTPAASIAVAPAISALGAGAVLGGLTWPVLAGLGERAALSKAVLCGLSVAQGMLVPRGQSLPGWMAIGLVFILLVTYFRAVEQ